MTQDFSHALFLHGACTLPEVRHFINTWCHPDDRKALENIESPWKGASEYFRNLAVTEKNISESVEIRDVSQSLRPKIDGIEENLLFKRTFSQLPHEIKLVEIEKIITCQRVVNLDYIGELKGRFPPGLDEEAVFDICMNPVSPVSLPQPVQTEEGSFVFSDVNPNFRFLGGFPKGITKEDVDASLDGGLPVASVVLLFGYDYGAVNAYRIRKRLILNNGCHRLYALRSLGVTHAPVVIQHIDNPDLEFPPYFQKLPREYLIEHPRPAMMRGFFDSRLTARLRMKNRVSNVRISWAADRVYSPPV